MIRARISPSSFPRAPVTQMMGCWVTFDMVRNLLFKYVDLDLCLRVAVGADRRRMPNGTRKAEKRKVVKILKILHEKPQNPERQTSTSQEHPRKVGKVQQQHHKSKSRKAAKSRKVRLDAKRRKVKNRETSNSISGRLQVEKSTSRNVNLANYRIEHVKNP